VSHTMDYINSLFLISVPFCAENVPRMNSTLPK
jgi:hypothetical protein